MSFKPPLAEIEKFEVFPDDVYLLSFPKSGTTWMKEILSLVQNDGNAHDLDKVSIDESVVQLDYLLADLRTKSRFQKFGILPDTSIREMTSPRIFSSHLRFELLPKQLFIKKPKIIYIARNPKDVAVSCYFFQKGLEPDKYSSFSQFLTDFMTANTPAIVYDHSHWHDHVLPWWHRRNDENVLFLKYEDMVQDVTSGIRAVANFLGKTLDEKTEQSIAHHVSFQTMKSNPRTLRTLFVTEALKMDPYKDSPFVRKGKVGGWKDYFSAADNDTFDALYRKWMKGSDLELTFELGSSTADKHISPKL